MTNVVCFAQVSGSGNVGGLIGEVQDASYDHLVSGSTPYPPEIKNCLYLGNAVSGSDGFTGHIIGNYLLRYDVTPPCVGAEVINTYFCNNNLPDINEKDVRAYIFKKQVTVSPKVKVDFSGTGVAYNDVFYAPNGATVNFNVYCEDLSEIVTGVSVNGTTLGTTSGSYSFTVDASTATEYIINVTTEDIGFTGEGTAENPYIITTEEQWNTIAREVAQERNFSGQYLKLANDISVTTMVGTSNDYHFKKFFAGNFNGDGHTLTFNCVGSKTHPFTVVRLEGSGTAEDPFTIASDTDWEIFSNTVNQGNTYSGQYVSLTADITVSTMVGTSDHPFAGTFTSAEQKTLTFNCGTAEDPFDYEYCAPFRYIDGATIEKLNIAGIIYTDDQYAGGLVAQAKGAWSIKDCVNSVSIHSTMRDIYDGFGYYGGFVGEAIECDGKGTEVLRCIFKGQFVGGEDIKAVGGFVGEVADGETLYVKECLFMPYLISLDPDPNNENNSTIARGETSCDKVFYLQALGVNCQLPPPHQQHDRCGH